MVAENSSVCRFRGQKFHDPVQRVNEAEVEHPVGFIEDQDVHMRQSKGLTVDQIEQAPGGGDENVHTPRQLPLLRAEWDATEGNRRGERHRATIRAETLCDLARQLSSGNEHKRPADAGLGRFGHTREALQNGQRESGCLAGPGLGDAAEIAAAEDRRDGLGLDRGRCRVPLHGESAKDWGGEPEIGKAGQYWCLAGSLSSEKAQMTHRMHLPGRETTRAIRAVKLGQGTKNEPISHPLSGITHAGSVTWLQAGARTLPYLYACCATPGQDDCVRGTLRFQENARNFSYLT
jgi:hypothetical protein